jgi:dolichol-phosphate mannosyltransferase
MMEHEPRPDFVSALRLRYDLVFRGLGRERCCPLLDRRFGAVDVSLVVPARNEAGNILPLVDEIRLALDGLFAYEVIYVDDGSTDATLTELHSLKEAGFASLRILRHAKSYGQSAAIASGVRVAQAPWIVTLDADGQNDPADVPRLLKVALNCEQNPKLHLIAGYRRRRHDSWVKRVSSMIANGVRARMLRDNTPDTGCGLKVFSRETFLQLPYFDHMHRFLPALIQRQGGYVNIVEVNHRRRVKGRTKYGVHNRLWVGMVDLLGVMWLQRRASYPEVIEES